MLPGDDHTNDSLHNEFTSLTMLLTLVMAVNNGGNPIFKLDLQAYRGTLEISQPASNVVLNAVAALLVQNHEIIAVAGQKQTHGPAPCDEDSDGYPNQEDADIAMDEGVGH